MAQWCLAADTELGEGNANKAPTATQTTLA